jgi:uncharacterized protein
MRYGPFLVGMPLTTTDLFRPTTYLWNGHLQTVIPSLLRKIPVRYVRVRLETSDGDFLDVDLCQAKDEMRLAKGEGERLRLSHFANRISPLAIISHGLEGDTTRQYVAGMVRELTSAGFDCMAWHYRSCSGEMNRLARFYHIGETGDLQTVIDYALTLGYEQICLVGFSAGGNITLKYLGEVGTLLHPAIRRAVAISVPLDLTTTADRLEQWDSMLYNIRFQRTLKRKIGQKTSLLPEAIRAVELGKIRSLRQFDDLITAPLHGFGNASNYYRVNSSLLFLPKITVPTLVINARNDPFLSPQCFPEPLAEELTSVWMEFPKHGGHCGFTTSEGLNAPTYAEERTADFLTSSYR